ncbi:MAG: DUF4175 domain-containing protein [Pirellulales bacterium]|nr:DUF4175 domain-containing protein [Pirellulales bacterium]
MMSTLATNRRLAPQVYDLLGEVRARFRRYVWTQSVARWLTAVGLMCAAWLVFDWALEPARVIRMCALGGAGVLAVVALQRLVLRRIFVPLSDRRIALLLERRFGDFDDSLLTAVELTESPVEGRLASAMLDDVCYLAAQRSLTKSAAAVFDYGQLRQALAGLGLLAAILVTSGLLAPQAWGIWFRRNVLLADELWPRRSELKVVGFDEQGRRKIARGSDFELVVQANTKKVVPEIVSVRYRTEEGVRGRENLSREGQAQADRDEYQVFAFTFQSVPSSRSLDVLGGDARLRDLKLEVVDSPAITEMSLDCRYPDYTGLAPRSLAVTGTMQLARGVEVALAARTNKPLQGVEVRLEASGTDPQVLSLEPGLDDPQAFSLVIPKLLENVVLAFKLRDRDGIENREPIRVTLTALADAPPQIAVRPQGIGTAVTPQARLPWLGKLADDYGLSAAWFEATVDGQPARELPLEAATNRAEFEVDLALEARDLNVRPGQKLELVLKARDNDAVSAEPNLATGEKYLFDVVTPEELRAMLASRELNLRRRFETLIEEVTATHELLVRLDLEATPRTAPSDDQPGADGAAEDPAVRRAAQNELAVERARQNATKNANETLGLSVSFAEICAELVNNRVDSTELLARLRDGVAEPLRTISEQQFPELDRRVKALAENLSPGDVSRHNRDAAAEQTAAILREMQGVLGKMLELETYNEVVELLRQIIEAQGDVTTKTQAERKAQLQDLLE